jgi:hypothetical protein
VAFRSDVTVDFSQSPRIVTVKLPSVEINMIDLVDTLRVIEARPQNMNDDSLILSAAGAEDLGGGVFVGLTITLNNAKLAFEARTTSVSDGAVTSADTSGVILTDTSATFVADGVLPGGTAFNVDDQSAGTVVEVLSETQLRLQRGLRDGSDNQWEIGDAYKVWNEIQCNVTGGNLVAVDDVGGAIDAIFPTAFTQVVRTSSASATIAELEITNLQHMIESLQGSFSGHGNIFYWDPYGGNDANTGDSPARAVKTFFRAHAIASDNNNDLIFALATDPSGVTTTDELVSIYKNTLQVRGPGDNLVIKPTAVDVPTVSITGNFVGFRGFQVETAATGTGAAVEIAGSEGYLIENVRISGAVNHGLRIIGGSRGTVKKLEVVSSGGYGIHLDGADYCNFSELTVHYCGLDGIFCEASTHGVHLEYSIDIHGNAGWGFSADSSCQESFISSEARIFSNTLGDINDLGSESNIGGILARDLIGVKMLVEAQRPHHTGMGDIIYWDPYGGDDTEDGKRHERAVKTFARAHAVATDSNHDVIIVVPGNPAGATVIDEILTITKNYLFVRGPGRDVVIRPTDDTQDTLTINANGVEVSGMIVETAATGSNACVAVNGNFALLKNLWVSDGSGHGVVFGDVDACIVEVDSISGCAGDGILVNNNVTNLSVVHTLVYGNGGNGINLLGTGNDEITIEGFTKIHSNTGWGILAGAGTADLNLDSGIILADNTAGNLSTVNTPHYSGDLLVDRIWDELSDDHVAVGSLGGVVRRALGRIGENIMIDETDHDESGQMTDCRFRLFANATDLAAATLDGTSPPDPTPIATWRLHTDWEGLNRIGSTKQNIEP